MKKALKIIGIGLATIVIIWPLYAFYGRKYIARIGRLPEGTQLVLIDTNDKPSQSKFSNESPPDFYWPVPQKYKTNAENFHEWLINFHEFVRTGQPIKENKPALAVVFNLPTEEIPALASFAGKVQRVSMTKSGDGPEIAEVELSNDEYVGRYEYILNPTVKEGSAVQRGDIIGTIILVPRAIFPKENQGPWKKRDVIGNFNFQFSLFKTVESGREEPVWITTKSFMQPK